MKTLFKGKKIICDAKHSNLNLRKKTNLKKKRKFWKKRTILGRTVAGTEKKNTA